ncbi:MAG: TlpA disulfide reductase family protein, partial [Opitutaceae bacterium]
GRRPGDFFIMSFHNSKLVAALVGLSSIALVRADVKVGDAFPALESAGLSPLSEVRAPAFSGQITLVDFWASWCAPCKASFPAMAKLHADYGSRGFAIVAVSIDEKPESAAAFWKKMAVPFAGVHDRTQKLVKQVVVPTMPTSYLLDRNGKVRFVHEGFHGDASARELRRQIELLLAEKS